MTVASNVIKFGGKSHMRNVGLQLLDLTFVKTKVKERKEISKLARQHPATHNPVTCGIWIVIS